MTQLPKNYDDWRLSGPPEWEGPTCDYCGTGEDIRVNCPGFYYRGKNHPAELVCEECFTGQDDGPCFDDLQTADDYAEEQADLHGDHLHDQARDRKGEE